MAFLTKDQIQSLNFKTVGDNVRISEHASFYGASSIEIGNNVRIDDFCILSAGGGGIHISDYIHIAAYSSLIGDSRITLGDFSNLSSRVSIYSNTDDFSGAALTNPTIPSGFTNVISNPVNIGKHCIIGAGSVVLPGVILETGVAVGALSLVNKNCSEYGI